MTQAFETITPVALGMPADGWGMQYAPDLAAPSIAIDFAEVKSALGLPPESPLHVLSDLDRTLRVTHAGQVESYIAGCLREQLVAGVITSLTVTTNSWDADCGRFAGQIHDNVATYSPGNTGGLMKPSRQYFDHVVDDLGIRGEPTLVIGDKTRRDVLGARRAGLHSLLVDPLGDRDLWFDRWGLRAWDNLAMWIGSQAVRRCQPSARAGQ
jgi:predicted HAD superfamily phosphohydrolase YqeG